MMQDYADMSRGQKRTLGFKKSTFEKKTAYVHLEPRKLLFELACRKHKTNPFPEAMLSEARVALCDALTKHGARRDVDLQDVPARQPFRLALLEEFLRICGDPDAAAFYSASDSFAQGVRIGVNTILPRTPSVFEPKTKWRNYEGELEADLHMRSNYPTAIVNADVLEQQFEEEEKLGAMVKMPQVAAQDRYGAGLRIASLGAIQKADNSFRVIHDGTHGTGVNGNIHVRDQLVCPTAGDVRQAMRSLEKQTCTLDSLWRPADGKYCLRSSCCACQAFRPYACMFCMHMLLPMFSFTHSQ